MAPTVFASQVQLVVAAGIVIVHPAAVAPPLPIRISKETVPLAPVIVEFVPPHPFVAIVGAVFCAKT